MNEKILKNSYEKNERKKRKIKYYLSNQVKLKPNIENSQLASGTVIFASMKAAMIKRTTEIQSKMKDSFILF